MVKEGHDSTVRPKTQIWEVDQGRMFVDAWAADGKPGVSKAAMQRVQAIKVIAFAVAVPVLLLTDYGHETFLSPVRRRFSSWWDTFTALDAADAAKARAVMPASPPPSNREHRA